jgi:hypothetical protein
MQDLVAEYQQYQEADVEEEVEGDIEMDGDYEEVQAETHQYE